MTDMAQSVVFEDQHQFFSGFVKELTDYADLVGDWFDMNPETPWEKAINALLNSNAIDEEDKVEVFQPIKPTFEYINEHSKTYGWNDNLAESWNKTGRTKVHAVLLKYLKLKRIALEKRIERNIQAILHCTRRRNREQRMAVVRSSLEKYEQILEHMAVLEEIRAQYTKEQ